MTFDEFITKWTNKPVDFDGIYPNQCMDLMHQYVYDVLGLTDKADLAQASAYLVYTNFQNVHGSSQFEQIPNTPTGVPQKGDIVFFGQTIGADGHVCIFINGDENNFTSFDANWPLGSLPHQQQHNYTGLLGWLRIKAPVAAPTPTLTYNGQQAITDAYQALTGMQPTDDEKAYKLNELQNGKNMVDLIKELTGDGRFLTLYVTPAVTTATATDQATITNLNKQIPDLEGQISTLNNQVTDLTQKLLLVQSLADKYTEIKPLYDQAESDLATVRQQYADYQQTMNRKVAQLENSAVIGLSTGQLFAEAFKKLLHIN